MKCVICKKHKADRGYITESNPTVISVTCMHCRSDHYPEFMKSTQYRRYWDAFNIKWRKGQ